MGQKSAMPAEKKQKMQQEDITIKIFDPTGVSGINKMTKQLERQDYAVLPPQIFLFNDGPKFVLIAVKKEKLHLLSPATLYDLLKKNGILLPQSAMPETQTATIPLSFVRPKREEEKKQKGIELKPSGQIELPSAVSKETSRTIETLPKKTEAAPEKQIAMAETAEPSLGSFEVIHDDKNRLLAFKGTVKFKSGEMTIEESDPNFLNNPKDYFVISVKKENDVVYKLALGKKYLRANSTVENAEKGIFVLTDSAKNNVLEKVRFHLERLIKDSSTRVSVIENIKSSLDKLKIEKAVKGYRITTGQ